MALATIKGVKTVNEIAQDHGVHPSQASVLKKELLDKTSDVFEFQRRLFLHAEQALNSISLIEKLPN